MPGGKPTMYYALSFLANQVLKLFIQTPGFPIYESMINYTGAKAVPYELTER